MECYCLQQAVWRNGGRSPQKRQCEFESLYPAGSSVEAADTQSRHPVMRNLWTEQAYFGKIKINDENTHI